MKKFILGVLCGVILTGATAAYASDMVQTYLFPAKFVINGENKALDDEYVVLNYNGHAYVPVRFISEQMGSLVKYEDATTTIQIDETAWSKKLQLNEAFRTAVSQGKFPSIEFGLGAAKNDVYDKWGEPQRTGSRQDHFDAWFDYMYFFTGPNDTVRAVEVSGDTINYSIAEVKQTLGQPEYEGASMIEDGWELTYRYGDYLLFFTADKKDGTVHDLVLKKNEHTNG